VALVSNIFFVIQQKAESLVNLCQLNIVPLRLSNMHIYVQVLHISKNCLPHFFVIYSAVAKLVLKLSHTNVS